MDKNKTILASVFLLLLLVGCNETKTFDGSIIRKFADNDKIKIVPPKAFFTASMKNNNLSKNATTRLFQIIHETDDYVYAGYISLGDLYEKRDCYSKLSKYNKSQLIQEFPLYKTFTSTDAIKIMNGEHAKYDPFVINKYQHLSRRKQSTVADYNDSHMIFTQNYEYSGDHGPWNKFKMIVKISKTNISDISSENW